MRIVLTVAAAISLAACSRPADRPADASAAVAGDSAETGAPQADAAARGNAAVRAPHSENAGPPAAGANSFTEGQARTHIEKSGYANVSDLIKDANGVWHGRATKGGVAMNVALDFKGNVVANYSGGEL